MKLIIINILYNRDILVSSNHMNFYVIKLRVCIIWIKYAN